MDQNRLGRLVPYAQAVGKGQRKRTLLDHSHQGTMEARVRILPVRLQLQVGAVADGSGGGMLEQEREVTGFQDCIHIGQ